MTEFSQWNFCQLMNNNNLIPSFSIIPVNRDPSLDSKITDDEGIPDTVLKQVEQRKYDPGMWERAPVPELEELP